jgi:hypothetical protein
MLFLRTIVQDDDDAFFDDDHRLATPGRFSARGEPGEVSTHFSVEFNHGLSGSTSSDATLD